MLLQFLNFHLFSITVFSSMYLMIRATKASKGSSYGKDKSPAKSCNGASYNHDNLSEQDKELLSLRMRNAGAQEVNTKEEQNSETL